MADIKELLAVDVELIPNHRDMSVGLIYDNCTLVVSRMQRLGIWESDLFLKLGFKKSVQRFRGTEVGKGVKSAAFEFVVLADGVEFEPIPESFNVTSHDYYMSLK